MVLLVAAVFVVQASISCLNLAFSAFYFNVFEVYKILRSMEAELNLIFVPIYSRVLKVYRILNWLQALLKKEHEEKRLFFFLALQKAGNVIIVFKEASKYN